MADRVPAWATFVLASQVKNLCEDDHDLLRATFPLAFRAKSLCEVDHGLLLAMSAQFCRQGSSFSADRVLVQAMFALAFRVNGLCEGGRDLVSVKGLQQDWNRAALL